MITQEEAITLCKWVKGVLRKSKPPPSNLSSVKSLWKRDDILILLADKGRAAVDLDKHCYDSKVLYLLKDDQTYNEPDKDPTPSMERKLNALLLQLRKKVLSQLIYTTSYTLLVV